VNITNIVLASALVMAASGEASAQTNQATMIRVFVSGQMVPFPLPHELITQTELPYFASPQAVNSKPLGQFAFNTHICSTGRTYNWNGIFFQYVLPSGELVYTPKGIDPLHPVFFRSDTAGDKSCMSQVASTTLPDNISSTVQTPPTMATTGEASAQTTLAVITKAVASSTETSGTIDSANDPSMRADIADVVEFNRSSLVPNQLGIQSATAPYLKLDKLIENDPDAGNPETKRAIADVFFLRGRNWRQANGANHCCVEAVPGPRYMKQAHMETNNDWIYDDQRFNDMQRARFWYQRALDQTYTQHPDCTHGLSFNCPSDPSGRIASSINIMENNLAFCPTVLQRQQERATAEKEKRDAAVRQSKEQRDAAAQQKAADAYRRTPEGKQQCQANCDTTRYNCKSDQIWNDTFGRASGLYKPFKNCEGEHENCAASCK